MLTVKRTSYIDWLLYEYPVSDWLWWRPAKRRTWKYIAWSMLGAELALYLNAELNPYDLAGDKKKIEDYLDWQGMGPESAGWKAFNESWPKYVSLFENEENEGSRKITNEEFIKEFGIGGLNGERKKDHE